MLYHDVVGEDPRCVLKAMLLVSFGMAVYVLPYAYIYIILNNYIDIIYRIELEL